MRRRRCDIRPHVSNEDRPTVEIFLIVEFAAPILKLADDRRQTQGTFGRVGPVKTPLMRLRIV